MEECERQRARRRRASSVAQPVLVCCEVNASQVAQIKSRSGSNTQHVS